MRLGRRSLHEKYITDPRFYAMNSHGKRNNFEVNVKRCFRDYLSRLGYDKISIRKNEFAPGYYVVFAVDPVEMRGFGNNYTVDEMFQITRTGNIFWRYVK